MTRNIIDPAPGDRDRIYSVSELAREFGITARAIRFYEGKNLIAPGRVGANRAYTHKDRARLVLILRGKRMGFSLREIKAFLDLYHADPSGEVQMRSLAAMINERVRSLEHQREVLDATIGDLRRMAATVEQSLSAETEASAAQGAKAAPDENRRVPDRKRAAG